MTTKKEAVTRDYIEGIIAEIWRTHQADFTLGKNQAKVIIAELADAGLAIHPLGTAD